MKKFFFSIGLFLLLFSATNAQIICGQDAFYPSIIENQTRLVQQQQRCAQYALRQIDARSPTVYRIKVVVHVLYRNASENLSDSIIAKQIEVLTRDFRGLNSDIQQIRPVFADRVGDANIEFELVSTIRKPLTINLVDGFGGLPLIDAVKVDSLGGSSPENPEKFLNIWICGIPLLSVSGSLNEVLGYATLPDSLNHYPSYLNFLPFEDTYIPGVVVEVATISDGTPKFDPVSGQFFTGRTLTHEVGHYLGLLHTFDSLLDILFGNTCQNSDGILDTPPQQTPTSFCNTPNTCPNDTLDEPDMAENHMNYSNDSCRVAFTLGQIAVMRGVLENERSGLLDENTNVFVLHKSENISLFPNPVSDYFDIKTDQPWQRAVLRNSLGQYLNSFNFGENMRVAGLPGGVYALEVFFDKNEHAQMLRMVKH